MLHKILKSAKTELISTHFCRLTLLFYFPQTESLTKATSN